MNIKQIALKIENAGGKIIGIVLNGIKLPKAKKTKEQRKDEFVKFRLKIKEKIDTTIENLKRKISQINQKLLEEPKTKEIKQEEIETSEKDVKENNLLEEKIEKNIEEKVSV